MHFLERISIEVMKTDELIALKEVKIDEHIALKEVKTDERITLKEVTRQTNTLPQDRQTHCLERGQKTDERIAL